MPKPQTHVGYRWAIALLLLTGFLLRWYFVQRHAFLAGDSLLYQDIAQSWLHKGIYGFANGDSARPTLIRLPGYPIILAGLAAVFDPLLKAAPGTLRSFLPVFYLQIAVDLLTCWLCASIARTAGGRRAGVAGLALSCLCPFMANYTAVPLTETFTLFFLALSYYALHRWLLSNGTRWVLLLAFALAWCVLLRPDQGLLVVATLPVLYVAGRQHRLAIPILCAVLVAVPFLPWTVRNYRTFHVIQPLAPKQATDPWETAPVHFQRWFRTWAVDFSATQDAYWNYPESPVDVNDLPNRAFDTVAQRQRTAALLKTAGYEGKLVPSVEDGFEALAAERIVAHPVRYYIVLPAARLANMIFHPRTEMLPVEERWWRYREHPAQTVVAWMFALWNLGYVIAAALGFPHFLRRCRPLAWSMLAYSVLRCVLLLTLDNAEQRYTLEFFPILILFASALWMRENKETRAIATRVPL